MSDELTRPKVFNRERFPPGVLIIFILVCVNMVGYISVFSLIELHISRHFQVNLHSANHVSAAFNAMIFSLSLFGGVLGERFLGYRFAVKLACILAALGFFILMVPHIMALYWGLSFVTIALALMIPCLYVLLGRLYRLHDPWRDSGFTLVYIGSNIAGLIATSINAPISIDWGVKYVFLISAILMLVALWVFLRYRKELVNRPVRHDFVRLRPDAIKRNRKTGIFILIFSLPLVTLLYKFAQTANVMMIIFGIAAFIMVLYLSRFETPEYRKKLRVFVMLCVISVMFWSLSMLGPSAVTLLIDGHVDRHVFGHLVPTAMYLALNPLFIMIVGVVFAFLWFRIKRRHYSISIPIRIALGVVLMGFGFLVLAFGVAHHDAHNIVSSNWIVASYFLQACGELLVAPIGIAMVGEFSPVRMEGLMMGVFTTVVGLGGAISSFLSDYASPVNMLKHGASALHIYAHAFTGYGVAAVLVGIVGLCLLPLFKRMLKQTGQIGKKPCQPA
jgi:proton-dependent oligopeptide transporter, POT family